MSAAEKLERLQRLLIDPKDEDAEAAETEAGYGLIAALPEIIAVVKAAERKRPDGTLDQVELARALSALDEKLGLSVETA